MISNGSMSASRSGTRDDVEVDARRRPWRPSRRRSRTRPGGAEVLERRRAARARAARGSTRSASLSSNGSPICTLGRLASSSSLELGRGEHRRAADAVAAGAGAEQHERRCPTPAAALRISRSCGARPDAHRVDQAVLLVGRLEVDLAADRRHADRVAVVADARDDARRAGSASARESSSPKRSESSTAIGRAPSAKTSRRMPPTPVAAPWNGSTALGWLCDSTLKATARPSPTSTAPAFSPGPISTRAPSVGSVRSSFRECL